MKQNRTSISDTFSYKDICHKASLDDNIFKCFKVAKGYADILEHVSKDQGEMYRQNITINFPEYIDYIEFFKKNDVYGNPNTYEYENIGKISPTTLRYVKVLSDLKSLYKSLDGFNIIEIGVGYGGQCKIIKDYFNVSNYYLVDLKEVLSLSRRYLSELNVKNLEFIDVDQVQNLNKNFDLVISNYAFTELEKSIQDIYINNILSKSNRGYITCNFISDIFGISSYSLDELKGKLKNFDIKNKEEFPLTHPENKIIYW